MASLAESIKQLEMELTARPMRIAAHRDMPFAILRYPPQEEFALRKQLRLLAIGLSQNHGINATFISIARIVWDTIAEFGESDLFQTETLRGFEAAQKHVNQLLTSADFKPAAESVLQKTTSLSPEKDVVFLVRAGGFAPYIYRTSHLLDNEQSAAAPKRKRGRAS
ncbi:MAG: DUF1788 domain-containing protein [Acidobacteria bacterium]|nr:DUF1788 domain-containing protein [Acidobacteriota bacterium]